MNAKQLLELAEECSCGTPAVTDRLTKLAFKVAAAQKEADAQIARDHAAEEVAHAIETSE